MDGFFASIKTGFLSPFYGIRIILSDRKLRRLYFIPIILSSIIFCIFVSFLYQNLTNILNFVIGIIQAKIMQVILFSNPEYLAWVQNSINILYYVIYAILAVFFGVLCLLLTYGVATLLLSPFCSFMAEYVLIREKVISGEPRGMWQSFSQAFRMLFTAIKKTILFICFGSTLLVLSLIPGVNLISTFCFFLMLAFDITDYSFEACQWTLRQRFRFFFKNLSAFTGMAIGLALFFVVPVLNLFLLPAAVVGAAELLSRMNRKIV